MSVVVKIAPCATKGAPDGETRSLDTDRGGDVSSRATAPASSGRRTAAHPSYPVRCQERQHTRKERRMTDAAERPTLPPHVPTGIVGLDTILRGGLLQGGVYAIVGPPGAGKTILGNQLCFHHVATGGRAVYITLLTESHGRLFSYLSSLAFFDPAVIGDSLRYYSAARELEEGGLAGLGDYLRTVMRADKSTLLVLDGPAPLSRRAAGPGGGAWVHHAAAHGDGPAGRGPPRLRHGRRRHRVGRSPRRTARGPRALRPQVPWPWLPARRPCVRHHGHRARRVPAHRGAPRRALAGDHGAARASRVRHRRPRRDAAGGVLVGSSTLLLGEAGTGKTLAGASFLVTGAQAGEPGLYVGFFESPARLISKVDGVGLTLGRQVANGTIALMWQPPLEASIDALAGALLTAVRERGVRRLFIDGLEGFARVSVEPERIEAFFTALSNELRALDVTTVVSLEQTRLFDPTVEAPIRGVSATFENLLLLRTVELRAQLHRLVSIIKMRESAYDAAIHEFCISDQGIDVAATFASADTVLTDLERPGPAPTTGAPSPETGRGR